MCGLSESTAVSCRVVSSYPRAKCDIQVDIQMAFSVQSGVASGISQVMTSNVHVTSRRSAITQGHSKVNHLVLLEVCTLSSSIRYKSAIP